MGAELSMQQVRHSRGGRDVLRVDSLRVGAGERVCVLGPNGAGKTTLLRLLAGVEAPAAGEVRVDGVAPTQGGVRVRRRLAYATQRPGLLSTTVVRNVELPLRWRRVPRDRRHELARGALERLRVAHLAGRPAAALSGGEQQRVNLARALALDPAVLLLDEPAAGLDAESRSAFLADLEEALSDRATTVVQVTHRAEEAFRLADRVVVLVDGEVRQDGAPAGVHRSPADRGVAALLGYDNVVAATAGPDGTVRLCGFPTGLRCGAPADRVDVAVFAAGVGLAGGDAPGVPARVVRVTPGPGHRVVRLQGPVPLVAHVPLGRPAPRRGDGVAVTFDPDKSAVLPATGRSAGSRPPDGAAGSAGPVTDVPEAYAR